MSAPDGPHLSFPFRIGTDGRAATVQSLAEHVHDEVITLVLTNPGERPFLPAFGGGARRLVFEGAGEATAAMAKAMLSQALERWLGTRLTVEVLEVATQSDGTLEVDLRYRIAGESDQRRLRFRREGG